MDFKVLNIMKEVQDEVMEFFQFTSGGQMFESGVLILQTFAAAAKQGVTKMYFIKEQDGKKLAFTFDFLKLIEMVKDPNRPEGSIHGVTLKTYDNQDKASGTDNSAGPNPQ